MKRLSLAFLILLLTASGTFAQADKPLISTEGEGPSAHSDFRLGAGDTVEVRFFYNPELNETVQIRPDGHVSLQMVGDINLGTLTIAEATSQLETRFLKFLKTPSITLQVKSYASQKVYVGGEVSRPGVVPVPGKMSVLDAVMEAGGVKHTGNTSSVVLIRRSDTGAPVVHKISLKNVHDEPSQASLTILQPYDVILVPETKVAHVDRWVDQYIRQVAPSVLTTGFSYVAGSTGVH